MQEQSGRLFGGFIFQKREWAIISTSVQNMLGIGICMVFLRKEHTWNRLGWDVSLNPNYDSALDFQINYKIGASIAIWMCGGTFLSIRKGEKRESLMKQRLELCASFGNIPEYRDNVKNMRVGIRFLCGNLWVKPEISVPGISDLVAKRVRVLCSMGVVFEL